MKPTSVESLRQELASGPTSLDAANGYWRALANYKGSDVRSGQDIIEAFRAAALVSPDGVVAFVSGTESFTSAAGKRHERPFDDDLVRVLRNFGPGASNELRSDLSWILASIGRQQ